MDYYWWTAEINIVLPMIVPSLLRGGLGWGGLVVTKNDRLAHGVAWALRKSVHTNTRAPLRTMTIPAPLALYSTTVHSAWIDYNHHMMDGYYGVPFSWATDAFLDCVGLDAAYREQSGCTCYTAEGHTLFLRELKEGAPLRITTQLLGHDAKRIQLFHAMHHAAEGYLAATSEWMLIHVDPALGKGVPMPVATQEQLAAIYAALAALPMPPQAGRCIRLQTQRKA